MNLNPTLTQDLAPAELQRRLYAQEPLQLVDVREAPEFAAGRLAGAHLVPLGEIEKRAAEFDRAQPLVLICHSGKRAGQARERLARIGFNHLACLTGGLAAWEATGLPVEKDEHTPWALERQVRVAAGALVLVGATVGWLVHPGFYGLSAFVGAGLVFAGISDWCGMGLLLAKAPWNCRSDGRRCG